MTAYMVSAERIELCLARATTWRSTTELHADRRCLPELNRRPGSCSPLPYHLAKAPEKQKQGTVNVSGLLQEFAIKCFPVNLYGFDLLLFAQETGHA